MTKKKDRPYYTVIEGGKKERVYTDKEGIEKGLGDLIVSIFKAIFK